MILAIAVLDTPRSRKRRISSFFPSSRETPSEPFGRPSFRPEDLALASPVPGPGPTLVGALGDQVPLDLDEQREERSLGLRNRICCQTTLYSGRLRSGTG